MHKKVFSGLLIIALIAIALLSARPSTAEPKILRIGENCAQSGIFSAWDQLSSWEVDALEDIINESGGITVKGQRYIIEIVRADNKSDMDGAVTAARKLVFDKKVNIAIGPSQWLARATGPIYEQNNVLHLCPWNTLGPGELDASTPLGFLCTNATVGYYITGGFAALKTIYPDAKTVVPVGAEAGPAAPVINSLLKETGKRNGITVLDDLIPVPDAIVDVTPIAIKLNTYKDADAIIYVNAMQTTVAGIVKSLRGMGNNTPMICTTVLDCNQVIELTGTEAAIDVVTAGMNPGFSGNPPIMNKIYDKVAAEQGPYPMVMTNANCLYMLKQVIEAAQSLDVKDIAAKWESMETIDTVFGKGYICGNETYGIKNHAVSHPIPLQIIKDGACNIYGWIDIGIIP